MTTEDIERTRKLCEMAPTVEILSVLMIEILDSLDGANAKVETLTGAGEVMVGCLYRRVGPNYPAIIAWRQAADSDPEVS